MLFLPRDVGNIFDDCQDRALIMHGSATWTGMWQPDADDSETGLLISGFRSSPMPKWPESETHWSAVLKQTNSRSLDLEYTDIMADF